MSKKTVPSFPFDAVSPKAWKQQIQYELSGEDYNSVMIKQTEEGIKVKPFYTEEDLPSYKSFNKNSAIAANKLDLPANGFLISFEIYANNSDMAHKKALWCVEKGCEKLVFLVQENIESPEVLLSQIPAHIHVHLLLQKPTSLQVQSFSTYLNTKKNVLWRCSLDPLTHFFVRGNWWTSETQDLELLSLLTNKIQLPILTIDGRIFQSAGANMSHQLAHVLSHFTAYAVLLSESKLLSKIEKVYIQLHLGNNFLMEISKIKAFDLLWASLCKTFNIDLPYSICAEGATIDKTLYSNNTNSIRNSTQLLSAVLGGAHELICSPYDRIHKKSHSYSDRLAINQALILKHECHFESLNNPLTGSFAIEKLAYELAEKALDVYKSTEAKGGILAGFKNHEIQNQIQIQYKKSLEKLQKGTASLIGANYLPKREKLTFEKYPFIKQQQRKTLIPPLISKRYAMEWEQKISPDSHENR